MACFQKQGVIWFAPPAWVSQSIPLRNQGLLPWRAPDARAFFEWQGTAAYKGNRRRIAAVSSSSMIR